MLSNELKITFWVHSRKALSSFKDRKKNSNFLRISKIFKRLNKISMIGYSLLLAS